MRRYYRLMVTSLAFLSVVCFVFYKHRYDELYEMLESIGFYSSTNFATPSTCDVDVFSLWQNVGNLYVKTAYFVDDELIVIGLTTGLMSTKICSISGGNRSLIENVTVDYDFLSVKSDQEDFRVVLVKCKPKFVQAQLSSVTITDDETRESVTIPVEEIQFEYVRNQMAVCLSNTDKNNDFDLNMNIEFFAYHAAIGVKHFFYYTKGLTASISKALSVLQTHVEISVHLIPWNAPISDVALQNTVVKLDCLVRSLGRAQWVVLLNSNQVIYYEEKHTLNGILSKATDSFSIPKISVQCSENITEESKSVDVIKIPDGSHLRASVEAEILPRDSPLQIVNVNRCEETLFSSPFWDLDDNLRSISQYFLSEHYPALKNILV